MHLATVAWGLLLGGAAGYVTLAWLAIRGLGLAARKRSKWDRWAGEHLISAASRGGDAAPSPD